MTAESDAEGLDTPEGSGAQGQPSIEDDDLCKVFGEGENAISAFDHVTLRVVRGEFVPFVGLRR